ncbi:hypothetical protein [Marinobacter segnicrescens]|uniref:hypothetical protein n=1 Tax=Marinobacter segnicrescens TaxID=430453 RepID=UPI003A8F5B42
MKALKVIGLILFALIGAWYLFEDYWYRKAIPENIGLSYRISITSDSGFREACGTAVYKLGGKTAEAIKELGVKFFEESGQARGHSDSYYTYGEWRETPRGDWTRSENWSYELLCGGSIGESLYDDIVESGRTSGSYYSFKREGVLMVIPDKKLVVFSHNG